MSDLDCARCLANSLMHSDAIRPAVTIFDGESLCAFHFRADHLSKFDTDVPKGGSR